MKIVFCTLAINEWYRDIVRYALNSMKRYADQHEYQFILHTEESLLVDSTRSPCWFKIKLIKHILDVSDCDYVFWLDADCQIMKHHLKLEHFIDKYFENSETEIVLTQDSQVLNTGVMFIKNSDFTRQLMDRVWNADVADYFQNFHEQTVLANIFTEDLNVQKRMKVLPYGAKDELVTYWGNYYPDKHFVVHCAKCSYDVLAFMYMMDLFYPFKLDEETDDEYNERHEWINNPYMCRADIDRWVSNADMTRRYSARCKQNFGV